MRLHFESLSNALQRSNWWEALTRPWRQQKVAMPTQLWARAAQDRVDSDDWKLLSWDAHPLVQRYINGRVSGDADEHWLDFIRRTFAPKGALNGLSVGCGSGMLERHVIRAGLCTTMDACDFSHGALDVAEQLASREGCSNRIHYFVCDLNTGKLEQNKYDICFSIAALHHITDLEHALSEIRQSLHPTGLFVLLEYIGPSRFQWSAKAQALMTRLLTILPQNYRMSIRTPGIIKQRISRPSIADMIAIDPSEAVRSAEIIPELQKLFEILFRADIGGTLLHHLLSDIVGNFDPNSVTDRAALESLIAFEETLLTEKVIESDFAVIVARPLTRLTRRSVNIS